MNFETYTKLVDKAPGIMRPGLDAEHFDLACSDSNSIFINDSGVPLVVPLNYYPWFREEYFLEQGILGNLYFYAGWPDMWNALQKDSESMHKLMIQKLLENSGTLVFEQSAERDMRSMFRPHISKQTPKIGFRTLHTHAVLLDNQPMTYRTDHYVYIVNYRLKKYTKNTKKMTAAMLYGAFDSDGTTQLVHRLENDEIAQTYTEYAAAFSETRRHDPIDAIVDWQTFEHWMREPQYLKYVQRDQHGITNMFLLTDIHNIPYMQLRYFEQNYPQYLAQGKVLCNPLIYSRLNTPGGLAKKTTAAIARSFKAARIQPIVVVECNDVSDKYVMRIYQQGARQVEGVDLETGDAVVVQSVELLTAV